MSEMMFNGMWQNKKKKTISIYSLQGHASKDDRLLLLCTIKYCAFMRELNGKTFASAEKVSLLDRLAARRCRPQRMGEV